MAKVKRVSIVSIESLKIKSAALKKHWEGVGIKDNFFLVHILFFLIGLMHFLPHTFFVTANAYWMEKFRNVTSDDIYDVSKRTNLQKHFASGVTITNTIPNSIFSVLSALFGYKIKARSRVLFTLATMTSCFILLTVFVEVNTDSWQTLFFYVTFIILTVITAANAMLQIAALVLLAKFPPYFLKVYLIGEGTAAVFNSILQIVTLSVGTTTIASALMYFITGSCIMGFTLVQVYFSKYNDYYMYFIEHSKEDLTREMLSVKQWMSAAKSVWPILLIHIFYDLGKIPQTPVTALVVSENYGSGNEWNDVYFVPVITYLFADICILLGRVFSSVTKHPGTFVVMVTSFLRILIFLPLIMLCNAHPRSHLPVLLPHDWEYILVHWTLSFSNGYISNMLYLTVHRLVEPAKLEDSLLVLSSSFCTIGAILSPLSALSVELL